MNELLHYVTCILYFNLDRKQLIQAPQILVHNHLLCGQMRGHTQLSFYQNVFCQLLTKTSKQPFHVLQALASPSLSWIAKNVKT